jgi:ADP-ribose pyrophosphatase
MMVLMGMETNPAEYRHTTLAMANEQQTPAVPTRYTPVRNSSIMWHSFLSEGGPTLERRGSSSARGKGQLLTSQLIYEGPIFGVRRDVVAEPGGLQTTREVITHPGSVVVLPLLSDGRVVLIRQYRHAARQFLWELVAGRIDSGETPKQAAARELLEETGYRAKRFRVFLDLFPTPGFLEERMFLLLAEGLAAGRAQPEFDEQIEVRAYTLNKLQHMLHGGKLRDAKSVAGILYYLTFLR